MIGRINSVCIQVQAHFILHTGCFSPTDVETARRNSYEEGSWHRISHGHLSPCSSPGSCPRPTDPLSEHRMQPATDLHPLVQHSRAPGAALSGPEGQRLGRRRARMKDAEKRPPHPSPLPCVPITLWDTGLHRLQTAA